ncbi:DUF3135 domain-containing protein [Shewanella amazonensis]|uniref:DUF3135 domain-containing protein n=1 Tax=Shewanella amazonensis (strain ATCC BAA-1098 / SB2B) TaxID=326297 RepID=A1S5T9_SHEAM|nr:DUF3135 domain-containing protein [Shewanella amazonensis]ABL99745.1 hypothetical protein Sama_1538 [Shewanella amazonensis SB2B]
MTPLPDFDTLRWMADNEPQALDELRDKLNREVIDGSETNKAQLECLIYDLERQLSRCTNPYHRCVIATGMMRNKLHTLHCVINEPDFLERSCAEIIPLFKA